MSGSFLTGKPREAALGFNARAIVFKRILVASNPDGLPEEHASCKMLIDFHAHWR
jgi:hypothetical protein